MSPRLVVGAVEEESPDFVQIKLDLALAARRWRRRADLDVSRRGTPPSSALSVEEGAEGASVSVSLDVLVRSLLALGATRRDIALEIVRNA